MIENIKFEKYNVCGNSFIIIYETPVCHIDESQRSNFSCWILNDSFGVGGADNVLYVSQLDTHVIEDYRFRIFEQDGSETLFCGNGLLSVASCLHQQTKQIAFKLLTGIKSCDQTKSVDIGVGEVPGSYWVNCGLPMMPPQSLYCPTDANPSILNSVETMRIPLPKEQPWTSGLPDEIQLSGYFVFIGEPHLTFFLGDGIENELEEMIWLDGVEHKGTILVKQGLDQIKKSNQFIDYIGQFVNHHYMHVFPQGVHLNFIRIVKDEQILEYRTYERAIDCETLACGSGAVAASYASWARDLFTTETIRVKPHKCRWYVPNAELSVTYTDTGLVLSGTPNMIYQGTIKNWEIANEL